MGGKGGDQLSVENLAGPGGGGAGGVIAILQGTKPANLSYDVTEGPNGVNTAFSNNPYGATPGTAGKFLTGFNAKFDNILFAKSGRICGCDIARN